MKMRSDVTFHVMFPVWSCMLLLDVYISLRINKVPIYLSYTHLWFAEAAHITSCRPGWYQMFTHSYFLSLPALLSFQQPGSVPPGYRRLQDASSAQMSQLPLPDHAEVLEHRAGRQAGLQVPQGPTGQQLLRAGVTSSSACSTDSSPQGGSRERHWSLRPRQQKLNWCFFEKDWLCLQRANLQNLLWFTQSARAATIWFVFVFSMMKPFRINKLAPSFRIN